MQHLHLFHRPPHRTRSKTRKLFSSEILKAIALVSQTPTAIVLENPTGSATTIFVLWMWRCGSAAWVLSNQQQAMMQRLGTSNVNHCHEFSTCKSYEAHKMPSSTRNMLFGELDHMSIHDQIPLMCGGRSGLRIVRRLLRVCTWVGQIGSCCLVATFWHKCSLNNWISWSPLYEFKLSGWLCQRCSLDILKHQS